jgi:hypothetical protein
MADVTAVEINDQQVGNAEPSATAAILQAALRR